MQNSIEYNGYVIEPITRLAENQECWTLEVRISPADGEARARRCRAPNTYPTKAVAVDRCFKFGKQVVDGRHGARTTRRSNRYRSSHVLHGGLPK